MTTEIIPTTLTPRGGYDYTQPETNYVMSASTFPQLVQLVSAHRKANNLPVPFNIDDIIKDDICERRPELCFQKKQYPPSRIKQLTLEQAIRFTKTLFKAGVTRVGASIASSRAEICSRCEDNIEPEGCSGCRRGLIKKAIQFVSGANETAYDEKLKSCRYCGCFNAAQVWMPMDALQSQISEEENNQLPAHCWKKTYEHQPNTSA